MTIKVETTTDSVFLGGMLNENYDGTSIIRDPGDVSNQSEDKIIRDEGSNCELDVSAFRSEQDADECGRSLTRELFDSEGKNIFLGSEQK